MMAHILSLQSALNFFMNEILIPWTRSQTLQLFHPFQEFISNLYVVILSCFVVFKNDHVLRFSQHLPLRRVSILATTKAPVFFFTVHILLPHALKSSLYTRSLCVPLNFKPSWKCTISTATCSRNCPTKGLWGCTATQVVGLAMETYLTNIWPSSESLCSSWMEVSQGDYYYPGWRCLMFMSDTSVDHWNTKTHIILVKMKSSTSNVGFHLPPHTHTHTQPATRLCQTCCWRLHPTLKHWPTGQTQRKCQKTTMKGTRRLLCTLAQGFTP
jgi:hypothetical protein